VDTATLRDHLTIAIAAHEATMAQLRAVKPAVVNGRSDGRRVKYVRAETAAATLRAILDTL
jgi:hypothetical protein